MEKFILPVLVWNIVVMLIYGIDKFRAKTGGRRIRERVLLICAFFLGGWGAIFGMVMFNHKTSKMKFRVLVPLAVLVTTVASILPDIQHIIT